MSVWVPPKRPLCQNSNREGLQWAESFATEATTGGCMGPPYNFYLNLQYTVHTVVTAQAFNAMCEHTVSTTEMSLV